MSDLRFNTIAGTALASLLVVMGLRTAGETVFHPHFPEKPGYEIDISSQLAASEGPAGGGEEQAGPRDWGTLLADASLVSAGEKVFGKCASCHNVAAGGANLTGPNLYEVVNRTAGTHPGFKYSPAMAASAQPWTYDNLDGFLAAPAKHLPGTIMAFVGLKKPEDRAAVIAYLRAQAPSPAPLPAPLPPTAAAPSEAAAEPPAGAAASPEAAPAAPG